MGEQAKIAHTPGPWIVSDERETGVKDFASVISVAPDREGVEICRLFGGRPYCDGEGMANAELIASIPELIADKDYVIRDLLAALKRAHGYIGGGGKEEGETEGEVNTVPLMEQIEDAITLGEKECAN